MDSYGKNDDRLYNGLIRYIAVAAGSIIGVILFNLFN